MNENRPESESSIVIVEDEQDLLELLSYNLVREGYQVRTAATGEEGLRLMRADPPELVLLDLMLPRMDGLEVCRALKNRRMTASVSVMMLTAKGEEKDIVRGFELGADDYVTKPFSPRVLLARIQAVLRRKEAGAAAESDEQIIRTGKVTLDHARHEVLVHGEPVELTTTEFKLLAIFVARPGRVFTRGQLIESLHGGLAAVTDRSIDVQVVSLRRKLGEAGDRIQTIRGVGYRFGE